jgi:hypothetical protein
MRTFPFSVCTPVIMLVMASGTRAAVPAAGRLESVSVLAAGTGASLAVRTSVNASLVATTAADTRTAVIELVGITAERRDMAVADGSGMISRIAIEGTTPAKTGSVTRISVSLTRPYRHRVRISGNLVYVDFERIASAPADPPVRRDPPVAKPASATAGPPEGGHYRSTPNDRSTPSYRSTPSAPVGPVKTSDIKPAQRPAVASPSTNTTSAPRTEPAAKPEWAGLGTDEVSLLSRWLAITEPLQHSFNPASSTPVLGRAWVPMILKDGSVIFSYGDYAQLDDQLTFLLPFDDSDTPRTEAVTIPRSAVDLDASARAAESVRAARYTTTRGARDFAELSQDVSAVLNAVPSQPDPAARVRLVEEVRQRLIEWPAAHYGYRAKDVNEAINMLDPILAQLRSAAGVHRIELSLVAPSAAPLPSMTFRQPTLVDLIENAMRIVSMLKVPEERTAVLRTTAASLDRHRAELPAVWLATGERRVDTALKSEIKIDEAYRKLSKDMITSAVRAASDGNARAITALQSDLIERDRRLGGKRPDVLTSTLDALRAQYDVASRAQVVRDRRASGLDAVSVYAGDVAPALKRFDEIKKDLQQFDKIPPGSPKVMELRDALDFVKRTLAQYPAPATLTDAHGQLLTAAYLGGVALQESVDPRLSPEMAASVRAGAASEAVAMFERARHEIDAARRGR